MKKILMLMVAIAASVSLYAQNEPAPGKGTRILAHRGGRSEVDENTVEAYRHAFSSGCLALETDIRMTKDGELMILHDKDFKRMCGIDKAPEDMTAAEIRAIRTKEGHKIPFIKDLVDFVNQYDGAYVEFELKCTDEEKYPQARLEEYLDKVAAAVYANKPPRSIYLMTSFDARAMRYLTVKHPESEPMYLTSKPCSAETAELAKSLGVKRLACGIAGTSRAGVKAIHDAGLRVNLWPTKSVDDVHLAWLLGADYICTDIPAEAVKYIRKNNLPIITDVR